jgi:hypothetical protein
MNSLLKKSRKFALYGISAGFLAASTLAYAQDGGWPQASDPSQQASNDGGPDANPYGQPPEPPQVSDNPGPQQQQQPPYAQQQPSAPQQQQQPYGQPPQPPYAQQQPPYAQQQPQQQPPYGQRQQQPYGGGVYDQPAPPPIPAQITVSAGTYVTVRLNSRLASDRNHPGDAFTATLVEPVVVNGIVIAEPGETITGQVVEAQKVDGAGRLAVQLTDLPLVDGQRVPIQTQLIARKGDRFRGSDAGIVAGSTAAGAVIGDAVGWGTGAAIGAGAGALISLGAVLTHGHASVLYPEEVLTFRIQQPVTISTTTAPQAFRYVEPGEYNARQSGPAMAYPPAPPPPTYYAYAYPAYGYPYPYYWGPSVGFFFGPGYYGRGYYGRGYWGGHYYGGHYGGGSRGHR